MSLPISSATIPLCGCSVENGIISFQSRIYYTDLSLVEHVYFVLVDPDGVEHYFFDYVPVPSDFKRNNKETSSIFIDVYGDIDGVYQEIDKVTKYYGMRNYVIEVRPVIKDEPAWDGSKVLNHEENIQFINLLPIVGTPVISRTGSNAGTINFSVQYWNHSGSAHIQLTYEDGQIIEDLPYTWNPDNQVWDFEYDFNLTLSCNETVKLALNGYFFPNTEGEYLMCVDWKYSQTLDEIFTGECMTTNYPEGLHIFVDNAGTDRTCCVVKTALSNHMVSAFTATRTGSNTSVYLKSISNKGTLPNAVLAADVTDNDQIDASIAPIDKTDEFVVVWTSNAVDSSYRIYARRFKVASNGVITPVAGSVQISQKNGNYYAPRIVYNKVHDIFFVTWISYADSKVQSIFLKNDENLSPAGYEGELSTDISSSYFQSGVYDISNSEYLSIALFNAGENIIAAYNNKDTTVSIFKYSFQPGVAPNPVKLTEYENSNTITNFTMAFDNYKQNIKIVYQDKNTGYVYGDNISYFGRNQRVGSPVRLNSLSDTCSRPYIKRTPKLGAATEERNYVVAWETQSNGSFVNIFDSEYNPISFEREINETDITTDKPLVLITENQIAVLVEATNFGSEILSSGGILIDTLARTDN